MLAHLVYFLATLYVLNLAFAAYLKIKEWRRG